jgi:hypothetical protein
MSNSNRTGNNSRVNSGNNSRVNSGNNSRVNSGNNSRVNSGNNSRVNSGNNNSSKSFFNKTLNSAKSAFSSNKSNNVSRNNSANNSVTNKKSNSSTIFVVIAVVLLLVVLGIAGYFIYRHMNQTKKSDTVTKQFIPYIHDASILKRISNGSIPTSSSGNEYNINFWVYVNDYGVRRNEDKCILYKGETPTGLLNDASLDSTGANPNVECNPSVWLLKDVNKLRVVVGLDKKASGNCASGSTQQACQSGELDADMCEIEYFPLQKWVAVNITMRNNVVDIFFDGTLKKSCVLTGAPIVSKGDLLVCPDGGFNGYVSNMKYSNKALAADKIFNMYKSGPTL